MYYQRQLQNQQKQADLQKKLIETKLAKSRLIEQRQWKRINLKKYKTSGKQQSEQRKHQFRQRELQTELDASSVSTNAILNRSRIESALQVRRANQNLQSQVQRTRIEQSNYEEALYQAQYNMLLQRQAQMDLVRSHSIREQVERDIRKDRDEINYLEWQRTVRERQVQELAQTELRRQLYEDQILRNRSFYRPYSYY